MVRKLCLVAVAAVAVLSASASIRAQQTVPTSPLLSGQAGVFCAIVGTAVTSTNAALPNTPIRLREARFGHVLEIVMTDKFGAFEFRGLEPGNYVAELITPAHDAVLAATPIITLTAGQVVSTILRLPSRRPALGILGRSVPSVVAVTAAAVAAGVLAKSVVGAPATDRALPGQ